MTPLEQVLDRKENKLQELFIDQDTVDLEFLYHIVDMLCLFEIMVLTKGLLPELEEFENEIICELNMRKN